MAQWCARRQEADQRVVHVLRMILDRMEASLADEPEDEDEPPPEHWEDSGHVYIEMRIPSHFGADVDLNVHNNRSLIRVEA